MNPATITQLACTRCRWAWFPKTPQAPKKCPKCGSPYWNKPRVRKDWPKEKRARRQGNPA